MIIGLAACGKDSGGSSGSASSVALSVKPTSLEFTADGGSETVDFTASTNPSFTGDGQTWYSYKKDFSNNKGTATITVEANSTTSERTGKYTVKCGSESATITIKQAAGTGSSGGGESSTTVVVTERNPVNSLSNSNASSKAKALYKYLLSIYGKNTISGVSAGAAWDTGYVDYVYNQAGAGKYPGIAGFDYMFMNWPAKAWTGSYDWTSCPDYGDITPVKTAYNAGNIISICWHWSVPCSEDYFYQDNGSDSRSKLDYYCFYNSGKDGFSGKGYPVFSATAALTEGTWQNKVITYQIKRLAGFMQLLEDADIPVLFRPLHEAAGDYSWGSWFWWGYEGADAFKKLWRYLYDQLTNVYGLDNLIWVYTVQTSDAGSLASLDTIKEWYPGDEYVDIVGGDLYVNKNTTQADAFNQINSSVEGKKMVALSECGNLLNIDGYFKADAPWLYFMSWNNRINGGATWVLYCKNSDGSYSWNNTASDWKSALNNSHTLNRGDLKY